MVMQDVNHQLFTEDVLDELLLSMDGEDEKADTARAKEILNSLDLLDKVKLHPMSLSGGEKAEGGDWQCNSLRQKDPDI